MNLPRSYNYENTVGMFDRLWNYTVCPDCGESPIQHDEVKCQRLRAHRIGLLANQTNKLTIELTEDK